MTRDFVEPMLRGRVYLITCNIVGHDNAGIVMGGEVRTCTRIPVEPVWRVEGVWNVPDLTFAYFTTNLHCLDREVDPYAIATVGMLREGTLRKLVDQARLPDTATSEHQELDQEVIRASNTIRVGFPLTFMSRYHRECVGRVPRVVGSATSFHDTRDVCS